MGDELMQTMQEVDSTPRLIVECMTSTLAGRRFAFTATDLRHGVLLGRASDCHVRFDAGKDLKVSGHHALIDERDGKIMVRDQGSSNGVFLNDVRVTSAGAAVLSGSKLALGQEGAVMKLLVPGAPTKTAALAAAAVQAAAAQGPQLKPAPGTGPHPAPAPQPIPQKPAAPVQVSDHASGGMPSVQTDPALLQKRDAAPVPPEQHGSDQTKHRIRQMAEPHDSSPPRKSGAKVTIVGALVLLLLAAGAMAAWHFMGQ
jgi:FHA domain